MFSSEDSFISSQWRDLEDDMKKAYQDDMRELKEIQQEEDVIEEGSRCFRIDSTGALLTLENAVQHLYHFCATLPASSYVDLRPEFVFSEASNSDLVSARVILPNSVDPSVREAQGELEWKTQKNARRDAAFEAYVALHRAGLVNDHLLPLLEHNSEVVDGSTPVETRAALVDVAEQLNPWKIVAQQWREAREAQTVAIKIRGCGESLPEMVMILPHRCPSIPNFQLHLDWTTSLTAFILEDSGVVYRLDEITHAPEISAMLLRSTFGSRMHTDRSDFPALFVPRIRPSNLESWLASVRGVHAASDIPEAGFDHRSYGLVRDLRHDGKLHILKDVTRNIPESHQEKLSIEVPAAVDSLYLEVIRLPKRTDFLHSLPTAIDRPVDTGPRTEYLPASSCQVDRLPFACSQFALFIPSIMHRFEVFMVAEHLCDEVLSPVAFNNVDLVVTAISASGAQEGTNYQRLEFLGDSILKLLTSITLMAEYPKWHEGFLSAKKDHVVANARLSRAAVEVGLDQYILTKQFTGHKWRPLYNAELLKPATESKRQMSTKVLADVVEALIGAAYLDGIDEKALSCLKIFLPEIPWLPLSQRHVSLYDTVTPVGLFPPRFSDMERLVGYDFNRKTLLIEASTHPSYSGSNSAMSYQRLEFLGDSVLDSIVVAAVFANDKQLAHYQMHTMRTILVNAGFLAFLCMEHSIPETRTEVIEDEPTGTFHTTESTIPLHIWQFMRYTSPQIARAQKACIDRYEELHQ
ncbi:MAG: Dicer-like protein 2, partial [Pleopsidium flavum]